MEKKLYSLTNPQKSIWYLEKYYQGTNMNNICGTMTIKIAVDFEKFILAIKQFVKQNEGCRIRLSKQYEQKQYIAPYENFEIQIVDVQSNKQVEELTNEVVSKPFALYDSSLFRFVVYRFPDNHGGFIINMHHFISDSWTLGILVNEIVSIYSSLVDDKEVDLKSLTDFSYVQYINSEQEYQKSNKFEKDKQYWNNLFETIPDIASIPGSVSQNTSNLNSSEVDDKLQAQREKLTFSTSILKQMKQYCTLHKISLFNFLVAIYSIYISKVSNLDNFCLGTPILNRSNFKEKNTVGMFINTLPLNICLKENLLFSEFVSNISITSLSLLRHQKYSYQSILQDLRQKQHNLPGLYKIMISYQITKMNEEQEKIPHESIWFFNHTISNDMDIHIFDLNDTDQLNVAYDYKINKYSAEDIRKIHARIEYIILQILEKEDINISNIKIVTPKEEKQLIYDFNNTTCAYPKEKTVVQLFEEQVLRTPNEKAVIFENNFITYEQLNEKANQLAYYLKNVQKVQPKTLIGIMVNRSFEMVVGLLAILKCNCCYVPIDPEYPIDRIEYMIENSHSSILLTDHKNKNKVQTITNIDISLDNFIYQNSSGKYNMPISSSAEDLLYVIYTSGSTGKPKGVMITNQNVVNYIYGLTKQIPITKYKNFVSVTTMCFDIFVTEIWGSLTNGLTLILANEQEQNNGHALEILCTQNKVDLIQTTPSRFKLLLNTAHDTSFFKNFSIVMVGGEPLTKELIATFHKYPNIQLYNMYGPTETTVWSSIKAFPKEEYITIGVPIQNTQIYILDKNYNLVPPYTPGEIYIGGDGVAKGYYENFTLTQDSFINWPLNNKLLYRTKDLGYQDFNGEIIHLGRADSQTKINGFRVELGEIENVILSHPKIKQVVVTYTDNLLAAFYISDSVIENKTLSDYLMAKLPYYMIPKVFQKIDKFPLTPNGKINRKALPKVTLSIQEKQWVSPRNEIDEFISAQLKQILHLSKVNMLDSFIDLGGDSLVAVRLSSSISSNFKIALSVKDIFTHATIQELSNYVASQLQKNKSQTILPAEHNNSYPTSSAQKRIYYASQMDENSVVYNIPGGLLLEQIPDITKLENCFKNLIKRHSSLRTYFAIEQGELVQKIKEHLDFNLEVQNAKFADKEKITKEFIKPFSLEKAPLFRVKLVLFENSKALLLIDLHHIICDGISVSILLKELGKLYNEEKLDEKTLEYKDYAVWEKQNLENGAYEEDKQYFLNTLKEEIPTLNLPASLPRPSATTYSGDSYYITMGKKYIEKLSSICKKQKITPYMFLLCAYFILLYKYTGQEDIIVGTPIMNREEKELETLLGMFVNNLALRSKIDSNTSVSSYFQQVKDLCLEAFKHQSYPFDELVKALNLKREPGRNLLFDTMFIYQNDAYPEISLQGIKCSYFIPTAPISKFDLSLEVIPMNDKLSLRFEYRTDLFTPKYIENFAKHYQNLINTLLENVESPIAKVTILDKEEENYILNELNNTYLPYNKQISLMSLFEKQVEQNPNKTALIFEDTKITYSQLNEKINRLANLLVQEYKIQRNQVVSILIKRSENTVISMLAALKAGATYLLIDGSLPFDRILYMLENSKSTLLITTSNMKNIDFPYKLMLDKIDLNYYSPNPPNVTSSNEDGFCVIYTSGSTGTPKGVLLNRLGVINLLLNYQKVLDTNICDSFLSMSAISFDMFIVENFIPLLSGKIVILCNEEQQKIPVFTLELIKKYKANFLLTTPTRMNLLLDTIFNASDVQTLKVIQLGGEVFTPELYEKIRKYTNANIYNGYGPSEATACCCCKKVESTNITIGKPFYNTKLLICDKDLNLCPVGIPGELCVCGDGVGNGYINREDLTQLSFVPNPYENNILYRTGDIARFLENGEIEYIGRRDFQIKIRGLRVELSEIEKQLQKIPNITNSAVIYHSGSSAYIAAFYTVSSPIEESYVRQKLSEALPLYMVPKYFVLLEQLPITPNGKIDKKTLMNYNLSQEEATTNYVAPQTEKQELFCRIWSQLLNHKIGIDDNIFDNGADSLLAIRFKTELLSYQIDIPYANIFKYPTVRELEQNGFSMVEAKESYDYRAISNILEKNTILNIHRSDIQKNTENNVLLLGANGFVGIHILASILQKDSGKIYCIIRNKDGEDANTRFTKILHFYFGTQFDKEIGNRIMILPGSVLEKKLGLSDAQFEEVISQTSTIINAAAIVKHYGNEKKFKDINVNLTQRIVDICKKYQKRFLHISSISVSGRDFAENNSEQIATFAENNLYMGQDLENIYIHSKFEAERIILQQVANGLQAQILRLGNMTSRFLDGKFQINPENNAFIGRLKTFIELGTIPENFLTMPLEFTPVDLCADAIVHILQNNLPTISIYHLYNDQTVPMSKLVDVLKQFKITLEPVSKEVFQNKIQQILAKKENRQILSGIITDMSKSADLDYTSHIMTSCEFTKFFLNLLGFHWPCITEEYLQKYIHYLKEIQFI